MGKRISKVNLAYITTFILFCAFFTGLPYSNAQPLPSEHKITKNLAEKVNSVPPQEKVRVIIILKKPAGQFQAQAARSLAKKDILEKGGEVIRDFSIFEGMAAEIPASRVEALANNPNVELIVEDRQVKAFLTESVPLINADDVWNKILSGTNITGRGQTVCVIDTGVDYTHPDLGGGMGIGFKVLGGYDFVNNDNDPIDDNGHGTHVAGTIAANGNLKGVAPDANIIAIKVLNASGFGSTIDVLAGIDWCVSNASIYNITVISMSLGGDLYTSYCDDELLEIPFRDAINAAVARNITVVVATGNDANYTAISSPACIKNATRVGATYDSNIGSLITWGDPPICTDTTTSTDKITCFTNRGANFPDILLAPGALTNSTYLSNGYEELGGTSMATPHVSGLIALLNQEYRAIYGTNPTPDYLFHVLNSTGVPIYDNATGMTYYRVDALTAYNAIDQVPPAITFVSPTPENATLWGKTWIYINVTFSENVDTAILDWNGTNYTMQMLGSTVAYYNVTNLSEGDYIYMVYANDTSGNMNISETRVITVDLTPPTITLVAPTPANTTSVNVSYVFVNITASEILNRSILEWNGTNETMQGSGLNWYLNKTYLLNGNYTFRVNAQDLAGNWNSSEIRVVGVDAPLLISIESPLNRSYPLQNVHFNITANKPLGSALVSIDGGGNHTLTNDSIIHWYNTSIFIAEGPHNATFYVQDLTGDVNSSTVYFTVDVTPPNVSFIDPTPPPYYNSSTHNITINVSHAELYPDTLILSWNGTNISQAYSGSYTNITFDNLTDGRYFYYVWVNDTAGNWNSTEVRVVTIDTSPPEIINITPAIGSGVKGVVTISVVARDAGVGVASVVAEVSNATYSEVLTLINNGSDVWYNDTWNTSALAEGEYNITINATDLLGQSNASEYVTVIVDRTPPASLVLSPIPNKNISTSAYVINGTAIDNESGVARVWVSVDGGSTWALANGTLNWSYEWNIQSDGGYNITSKAEDKAGNNQTTLQYVPVTVDTTPPVILLLTPTPGDGATLSAGTTSVTINISVSEVHPDTLVLNWNDKNESFNYTSGYVSITKSVSSGNSYTFYVWANDTFGNANATPKITFSVASSGDSGGGGGGGGGARACNVAEIEKVFKGESATVTFDEECVPDIKNITIFASQTHYYTTIYVETYQTKPAWVVFPEPSQAVYRYFKIRYEKPNTYITKAEIVFKVGKAWLMEKDINPNTVAMLRYDKRWEELETQPAGEEEGYLLYRAITPGFSYFAVVGEEGSGFSIEEEEKGQKEEEVKDVEEFEELAQIMSLLAKNETVEKTVEKGKSEEAPEKTEANVTEEAKRVEENVSEAEETAEEEKGICGPTSALLIALLSALAIKGLTRPYR
jgi:PGF-pre-PGF domain-containing protein